MGGTRWHPDAERLSNAKLGDPKLRARSRSVRNVGLAIIGAEYVLRWLPKGTHQWEKFITPAELKTWLADNHVAIKGETGVTYHPLANEWRRSRDMDVNYMLVGQKA